MYGDECVSICEQVHLYAHKQPNTLRSLPMSQITQRHTTFHNNIVSVYAENDIVLQFAIRDDDHIKIRIWLFEPVDEPWISLT